MHGIPASVAGDSQEQSLKIEMPWPPPPAGALRLVARRDRGTHHPGKVLAVRPRQCSLSFSIVARQFGFVRHFDGIYAAIIPNWYEGEQQLSLCVRLQAAKSFSDCSQRSACFLGNIEVA